MSYNDLGACPQPVGDSLQFGLRPSREYAAHRSCLPSYYRCRMVAAVSEQ